MQKNKTDKENNEELSIVNCQLSIPGNTRISGSEALLKALIAEGVDTIFGYPGGQAIPIFDSLYDYRDQLKLVLVRHEQGATHAAQGYARVSGKVGVNIVTSGPGATNTITGIADAMMDSTPVVIITGQVPSSLLGTDAFQEIDVIGITQPITKWAYQVRKPEEIAWAISRAFYIASTGRPGPVVIDLAKDAQVGLVDYIYEKVDYIRSYQPVPDIDKEQIRIAAELINKAKKPLALIGQGVILSHAEEELKIFLEKADIPAGMTALGLSALPSDYPLNKGMLGMHGNVGPNRKTNECDVLIAIGMRFDDRVTGNLDTYAKQAQIIHFDIDNSEIGKNVKVAVPVWGDAKETLAAVTAYIQPAKHKQWIASFETDEQEEYTKVIQKELTPLSGPLKMGEVVRKVSEATQNDAVLVTDVGQNQMMGIRYFKYKRTRSVVTSGGLGTMGFGIPAAIGAQLGAPERTVCLFMGDGGLQMTLQEFGTIMQEKLPIKMIVLNNNFLGMVRQWQELFFKERYSGTILMNPDFGTLAKAYGMGSRTVEKREELGDAIKEMLEYDGTYLLVANVESHGMVYPMIPAGACITHIIMGE
ncbi:biosynthetic-type acetolactate synthase large subunit [Parabacteroides sp. 52]|uniref:biosynthetic-type acetolactate synthase large subunit n=1 Tax=unclassified Parabacteroides TaxID=2649774 RepID=UPI0013D321C9|nr:MULTISPECIES: biosynthetic-type acetolactate synthase large subunit [unclassified Parabacteroides]MDH6535222.1 acetolactate synthase-1/2/3 large subunit [Parabacteroides sp. PM5-20]NDV55638.1 biosynthetic-type acetolactate synthase large subunit [Parabacteroides sp. 52]